MGAGIRFSQTSSHTGRHVESPSTTVAQLPALLAFAPQLSCPRFLIPHYFLFKKYQQLILPLIFKQLPHHFAGTVWYFEFH